MTKPTSARLPDSTVARSLSLSAVTPAPCHALVATTARAAAESDDLMPDSSRSLYSGVHTER
jgi:hypothetical protein